MCEVIKIDVKKILYKRVPHIAKWIPNFIIKYIIKTIHQEELNGILEKHQDKKGVDFMEGLINDFGITTQLINKHLFPQSGRYIFVSNHPLGGMDGIVLSAIIGRNYQGRIKYLVNDLLLNIHNLRSIFIPINKHGAQNRAGVQMIEDAYNSDDQIITFPAGICSRKTNGKIQDPQWQKSFIKKAIQYKRDIVPIYFEAQNSNFFYKIANLRKMLGLKMNYEMFYLPDEMFKCKGKSFKIYIGDPISWMHFDKSKTPLEWAQWVKDKSYNLTTKD